MYPHGLIDPPVDVEQPRSPLRLYEKGVWDPAEQYWGEPDDMLEMCLVEVIAAGPRLQYEFEQLLPGGEDPDARDPILDAIELRDRGYPERARALLEGLIEWDARCIDAHAHLGGLAFDQDDLEEAQAHYATGVRIAETSLPDGFGGVLGWGWIDNRPFLRCLHGLTISTWRLEQHDRSAGAVLGAAVAEPRRQPGSTRTAPRDHRRRTLARPPLSRVCPV